MQNKKGVDDVSKQMYTQDENTIEVHLFILAFNKSHETLGEDGEYQFLIIKVNQRVEGRMWRVRVRERERERERDKEGWEEGEQKKKAHQFALYQMVC